MKCVIYMRCSGSSQISGDTYDRQSACCSTFATGAGFEIVREFREGGVSGTKESCDRPAYQEMLEFLAESLDVEAIIVEHLDRLARFYRVQETMLDDLIHRSLTLYTANTGENVTQAIAESPMRKFLVQIQGLVAELDRSQTISKLNSGRKRKREAGGKAEGVYPYGEDPKRPEEAPVLAEMRRIRKSGTLEQTAAALNASGRRGRHGGEWSAATVAKILRREAA